MHYISIICVFRDHTLKVFYMNERSIIHLNVADFAVAVERGADSSLKRRPVIIAPEGAVRATVYDMSDEAYKGGVRKGMAVRRALRYCPGASVISPNPDRYERAMSDFLKHAIPYSPLVEMTDHNGHLFIDVTGTGRLFGPPPDLAFRIRRSVRTGMGLDPIWAVAPNKLVAKVATRMVKPAGEYIVKPGDEASFLKPLPVNLIPGIEHRDITLLHEFNMTCAGHVTDLSLKQLELVFGDHGRCLHNAVRGIDFTPVSPAEQKLPSVNENYTFGNDTNDIKLLESALYILLEQTGANLRKMKMTTGRIRIMISYSDGKRNMRQSAVKPASANNFNLFTTAKPVLHRALTRRTRVRNIRLTCDRLTRPPAQMELFTEFQREKKTDDKLVNALDEIRGRFGLRAIQVGRALAAAS